MLTNTFQHIPGIGDKSETDIWESGIMCWDDFSKDSSPKMPPKKKAKISQYIAESQKHLTDIRTPAYFSNLLPSKLHWRFFPEFMHSAVYLDIETNGLDAFSGKITTIALYDGKNIFHYTNGFNLHDFKTDILKYQLIITYNGKSFDIPFIEQFFGIKITQAHLDLRHILASLGFKGGLKGCEKALGIDRQELDGVDGYLAVLLWKDYMQNKNDKALETLLAYNIEDVLNLDYLMVTAYNMKLKETPFQQNQLKARPVPKSPFQTDTATIKRLMSSADYRAASWY